MTQLASATDFVELPPDAAGKKTAYHLATVGGGGQLYIAASVLVDQAGNIIDSAAVTGGKTALYVANIGDRNVLGAYRTGHTTQITGAASAQSLLSIENPTGSGRTVAVKRIEIQGQFASATASTTAFLYTVARTTAIPSAGTALVAQKHQTTDAAAAAIVRTGPTATAATGVLWSVGPGVANANDPASGLQMPVFAEARESDDLILAPGEAVLVAAAANTTSWRHSVDVSWEEF